MSIYVCLSVFIGKQSVSVYSQKLKKLVIRGDVDCWTVKVRVLFFLEFIFQLSTCISFCCGKPKCAFFLGQRYLVWKRAHVNGITWLAMQEAEPTGCVLQYVTTPFTPLYICSFWRCVQKYVWPVSDLGFWPESPKFNHVQPVPNDTSWTFLCQFNQELYPAPIFLFCFQWPWYLTLKDQKLIICGQFCQL